MRVSPWTAAALLLTGQSALAEPPVLRHDAVSCVVAESFPRLEAHVSPAPQVAKARVHFRADDGAHWYFVEMTREGDVLRGVLPQPRKSLKSFRYYIDVVGAGFEASRTEEFVPQVEHGPGACQGRRVAAIVLNATVVVLKSGGGPALPVGFEATGLVAGGAAPAGAAPAGGGGSAGAATAGAGISATTIAVVGGAAAAAGVAVAVSSGGGEESSGSNNNTNQGAPAPPSATSPGATTPAEPRTLTFNGVDTGANACRMPCCLVDEYFFDVNRAGTLTATLTWSTNTLLPDLVGFNMYIVQGASSGPTSAAISAAVNPGAHKIRIFNNSGGTQTCRPAGAYTLVARVP